MQDATANATDAVHKVTSLLTCIIFNVGAFFENVGAFLENVGAFSKNVGAFSENVGAFFLM